MDFLRYRSLLLMLLTAVLVSGLVACDDDDDDEQLASFAPAGNTEYLPLKIGNRWVFQDTRFQERFEWVVVGTRNFNNLRFYRVDGNNGNNSLNDLLTNTADFNLNYVDEAGLYTGGKNRGADLIEPPELRLPETVFLDSNWQIVEDVQGSEFDPPGRLFRVAAVDVPVSVPAGDFTAIQVTTRYRDEFQELPLLTYEWFVPGIGLVKREFYDDGGVTPWVVHELVAYQLYEEDLDPADVPNAAPSAKAPDPLHSFNFFVNGNFDVLEQSALDATSLR